MDLNIDRAIKTEGFMQIPELTWLAEQASKHLSIVEVGSWMGRSTLALADNTRGKVYAVDTWRGTTTIGDDKGHEPWLEGKPEDWLIEKFKQNTKNCFNVTMVQRASLQAAVEFQLSRFDMVFIDASHDYENVKADISAWMPLLVEGGLLCGHDYNNGWPGVNRAVDELIPNSKIGAGTIWYRP